MHKFFLTMVLAISVVGCCPPGTIHVTALDPAVTPVVNEYEKYVATGKDAAGQDMSANAVKARVDAIGRLRELINKAKVNDNAGK
jgi:hypothetical protein